MPELYQAPHRGATHADLLSEENYAQQMEETVEPLLKGLRHKGFLTIVRGRRIHYEYYLCADPVGAVVLCHGFTESAEKYREMIYYFLGAGYSVFAPDLRGHGKSYRGQKNHTLIHVNRFRDYTDDLDRFLQRIVRPNAVNLPLYLYGHSMGGAVGALYLSQHPITFRKAVLSAPMIAPKTANLPPWLARWITFAMCLAGKGTDPVLRQRSVERDTAPSEEEFPPRFSYYHQKKLRHRHLQTSLATYRWLFQALCTTDALLKRSNCERVQATVLLFQAENDTYVHNKHQDLYLSRIPHGEMVRIPESGHGLPTAENEILQPYVDRILSFFSK